MMLSPRVKFKWLLRFYMPFIGAGIKVLDISKDWKKLSVSMSLRWYNKNIVGTHFGGSLYAMTDPFYVLLVMKILGRGYIVWDQSATIDFIKPGRTKVKATFIIDDEMIEMIKQHTASGDKYCPEFEVDVFDDQGDIVAKVHKTLYIRRKPN